MDVNEVQVILTQASAFDERKVSPELAAAWWHIIGHLDYRTAHEAMKEHYRRSRFRMLPADILAIAAELAPAPEVALSASVDEFCAAVGISRVEYELHALDRSWMEEVAARAGRELEQ